MAERVAYLPTDIRDEFFKRLWLRLQGTLGNRFAAEFGDVGDDGFVAWADALQHYRPADIKRAVRHLRGRLGPDGKGWAPNLPEFLVMCSPPELPQPARALSEAASNSNRWDEAKWSHAAVYHAAIAVSLWNLQHRTMRELLPQWNSAYQEQVQRYLEGALPEIPAALPAPDPYAHTGEPVNVESERDQCRAMFNL